MRQPEVEGKLGALGERTQGDQHQGGHVPLVVADPVAGVQHRVEVVAAHDMADDQHAGKQAQAAGGRHGERHPGATTRVDPVVPVADQQEGREAGQLPEEDELDQVAGQHHAQHRPHEAQQERPEARHRVGGRHVVAGVHHHEQPDRGDENREHPGEAVHAQREGQAERGQPVPLRADHRAVGDAGIERAGYGEADHRHAGGEPAYRPAGAAGDECRQETAEERKDEHDQQKDLVRHGRNRRLSAM